MKKALLISIFALSLPIASYALTCPSTNLLNDKVHSAKPGKSNPLDDFSAGGLNNWSRGTPAGGHDMSQLNFTGFVGILIPTKPSKRTHITCNYHFEYKGVKSQLDYMINNGDGGPFKGKNEGNWFPKNKNNCVKSLEACEFERA